MKVLDTVQLTPKKDCKLCFGKGYILTVRSDLDAERFREARSCPVCMKQVVRIEDDK